MTAVSVGLAAGAALVTLPANAFWGSLGDGPYYRGCWYGGPWWGAYRYYGGYPYYGGYGYPYAPAPGAPDSRAVTTSTTPIARTSETNMPP